MMCIQRHQIAQTSPPLPTWCTVKVKAVDFERVDKVRSMLAGEKPEGGLVSGNCSVSFV